MTDSPGRGREVGRAGAEHPDTGPNTAGTSERVVAEAIPQATVVTTLAVKPGRETLARRWLSRVIVAADAFPNNLGAVVLTPPPGAPSVFRLVQRFGDQTSLQAWEDSDAGRQLLAEKDAFSTSERQAATGRETWLVVKDAEVAASPKLWKLTIVAFFVAYAATAIIVPREQAWLPRSWSFYVVNIITTVILASLMTYTIPVASRVLRRWVY